MNVSNVTRRGKPLIIRTLGWLGFFLLLWFPGMLLAQWITGYQFRYFPPFAFLALALAVPLLVIWFLASVIYRIAERHAMMTAGELMRSMREQNRKAGQGGQP